MSSSSGQTGSERTHIYMIYTVGSTKQRHATSRRSSTSLMDWSKELEHARELQPTHRRKVLATEKYVFKIPLKRGEHDHFGGEHDPEFARFTDQNLCRATELVQQYTTIPVPKIVQYSVDMTVLEFCQGNDLESVYDQITPRKLAGIKLELKEYIRQLWTVPNPYSDQFAVGTLCDTHEILFTVDKTYPYRGPFRTTEEYRTHVPALFGRTAQFPVDTRPVFDHMDWYQSNIVLHPNLDKIAAIIDWEYAGFIPDPRDMHIGDLQTATKEWIKDGWGNIFDGLDQPVY